MTTNNAKCTDEKHRFQVCLFCEHQDCESLLCLGCLQTHKEDTGCPGEFGVHIKEIDDVVEETPPEVAPKIDTKRKRGNVIQEHTLKKTRLLERIQQVFDQEGEIHQQNGKKLDAFESSHIEYLQNRNRQWRRNQPNVLRKRSESFGAEIFSRLESIQETLENMHFDENNFSNNSQIFKKLNRQIAIEAEELIGLAEQAMDSWKLNKDRLDDYSKTLIKVIDGVEFSGLLSSQELVYDISDLTEFSEDFKRQNEELKTLRAEDRMLRSWINKLQNENNELSDLRPKNEELVKQIEELKASLESVTEERDDFEGKITQMEQQIQALRSENTNLTAARDQLAKEKADLTTENEEVTDERDGLKTAIETLKREKDDLIQVRDKLTQEKTDLSDAKEELENERDDLKGKVEVLTKEKEDLVRVRDELTQEKEDWNDAREELENERDGLKGQVETLTREKAGLVDIRDKLTREKTELIEKNKELEEKSSSE